MNKFFSNNTRSEERLGHISQEYTDSRNSSKVSNPFLNILWFACHFCFYLIQQVAEIFAPLFLVVGITWKLLPAITSSLIAVISSSDPQTGELVKHGGNLIPHSIMIAGHSLTAGKLIFDGVLLIMLTALCATVTVYLGRKL